MLRSAAGRQRRQIQRRNHFLRAPAEARERAAALEPKKKKITRLRFASLKSHKERQSLSKFFSFSFSRRSSFSSERPQQHQAGTQALGVFLLRLPKGFAVEGLWGF